MRLPFSKPSSGSAPSMTDADLYGNVLPAMTEADLFGSPKALASFGDVDGVGYSVSRDDVSRLIDLFDDGAGDLLPFHISPQQALRVAVVYRCCAVTAGHVMQCPVRIEEVVVRNGLRRRVPAMQDLEAQLNREPSELFSGPQMLEYQTAAMLLYGDGYSLIERAPNGDPIGLRPYHPSRVKAGLYEGGRRAVYRLQGRNNTFDMATNEPSEILYRDQADVIDWQGAFHDGLSAMSVVRHAGASAISLHRRLEQSSHDFFINGSLQRLLLRTNQSLTEDQVKEALKSFLRRYGGGTRTRNMPIILEGSEWEPPYNLRINPEDAQLLETREYSVIDVARLFGIPGILVGIEDKTSAWGSGVEVITSNFLRATVRPILNRFAAELTRKLAPMGSRIEVRLDTSELLRPSSKERSAYNTAALGSGNRSGWMSTNEVREREGLPPLDNDEERGQYDRVKVAEAKGSIGGQLDDALADAETKQPDTEGAE